MTLIAVLAELPPVHIGVATDAIMSDFLENQTHVTGFASDIHVRAAQRIPGLRVVIEFGMLTDGLPAGSCVATLAGYSQRAVGIASVGRPLRSLAILTECMRKTAEGQQEYKRFHL